MCKHRTAFAEPYFDTYQVGFALPVHSGQPDQLNWRQRTIAGVSWNGLEKQAYFFNPDNLTIPLEAHPYELPRLLARKTTRREFATVVSGGQFGMPEAQQKAMPAKQRGQWVTYWFTDEGTVYGNVTDVFANHAKQRAREARDDVAELKSMPAHFWPERLRWSPDATPELEQARQAYFEQQQLEAEQDANDRCAKIYAERMAYDKRISEWLRGEAGSPPLLAQMQGRA